MDPISIATGVGTLIGMTNSIIKWLVEVKDSTKEKEQLTRELESLRVFLHSLRMNVENPKTNQMWFHNYHRLGESGGILDQMHKSIGELMNVIRPSEGRFNDLGRKITWQFEKGAAYRLVEGINRQKSDITLALSKDQFTLSLQIKDDTAGTSTTVQALRDTQLEQEKTKFIASLSPLDFQSRHDQIAEDRVPGSGEWFLSSERFQEWRDESSSNSKLLYCQGVPGAGKTLISSAVIDHLKQQHRGQGCPVLFVYFDYKSNAVQTWPNILGSLLRQLCESQETVPSSLRARFDQHRTTVLPSKMLEGFLIEALHEFPRCYIISDALDEATERVRDEMLSLLYRMHQEDQVSIMLTSRDILGGYFDSHQVICDRCRRHIWGAYYHCSICGGGDFDVCYACYASGQSCNERAHQLPERAVAAQAKISANETDIKLFVTQRVEQEPRLRRCVARQPELKQNIINVLSEEFKDMFLPARLAIDILKDKLSPAAVREALKNMKGSLNSVYDSVLDRIRQHDWDLASHVLQWIIYSYRPLTVPEMQHCLACTNAESFDEDEIVDADMLVNICVGLVDIVDGCFHLVHKTAQEYFDQISVKLFPQAHEMLAKTCLHYLILWRAGDSFLKSYEAQQYQSDPFEACPFYGYAALSWAAHLAELKPMPEDVKKLAVDFLRNDRARDTAVNTIWSLDPAWEIRDGLSALHVASICGLSEIVAALLANGATVNDVDSSSSTVLVCATRSRAVDTILFLIQAGVDVNKQDAGGGTALLYAVNNQHVGTVKALLSSPSIDVNYCNPTWHASSALMSACSKGSLKIVRALLEFPGLDLNCENETGRTALWLAAYYGYFPIVQELLTKPDIDVGTRSKPAGYTPLHIAASKGYVAISNALLNAGAAIDITDSTVGTPLLRACDNGRVKVVKLLLRRGANLETKDKFSRTVLHGAALNGHHRVIRVLLEAGADPNVRGSGQETPLHDCISRKSPAHAKVAHVLLEFGAVVDEGLEVPSLPQSTDGEAPPSYHAHNHPRHPWHEIRSDRTEVKEQSVWEVDVKHVNSWPVTASTTDLELREGIPPPS